MSKRKSQGKRDGEMYEKEKEKEKKGSSQEEKRRTSNSQKGKSQFRKGKMFNDIGYYTKNPSISEAFAKLSFNWIVGNTLPNLNRYNSVAFPSIVSYMVDWMPSNNPNTEVGASADNILSEGPDVLDMVAAIVYMQERRANAGSTNDIEHVDVIISNLLASIDIFVNAHYCNRIFRLGYSYDWRNRTIPQHIFSDHLDIDYQDFIANLANYRGRYDMLIAKAKTIRTLANFPFVNAAMSQFDEIFKDSDTDTGRESLIVSVKPFHHIYDPIGLESHPGGSVRLMKWSDIDPNASEDDRDRIIYTGVQADSMQSNMKFSCLLDIMDAQINALINDKDFNLIQADIEKAFGDMSGYLEVDKAPNDTVIRPVYSNEFNLMFRNGKFLPAPAMSLWDWKCPLASENPSRWKTIGKNTVVNSILQSHYDNAGVVRMKWYNAQLQEDDIFVNDYNMKLNIIDSESDNPTVEDVIIATRFKRSYKASVSSVYPDWGIPVELKATIPSQGRLYQAKASSNFMVWGGNVTVIDTKADQTIKYIEPWNNCSTALPNVLQPLENHPIYTNSSGNLYANITNIRAISDSELDPIQRSCFLSLWDLPNRSNI